MSPNARFRVIDSWSVYIVKNHMGFGIFGQSKYQSLSQFFYIFEER